jgi:hypothetical protein
VKEKVRKFVGQERSGDSMQAQPTPQDLQSWNGPLELSKLEEGD